MKRRGTGSRADRGHAARRRGRWAEALCRLALRLKGYRIVAAGRRSGLGEIDILARRGHVLAAVEVKARGDRLAAAEALREGQRRRIARAALQFQASRPEFARLDLRFDAMLVVPWRWPRHVPDAWRHGTL
ncbi:MAG TPA: YraN family protein [Arenibaculum sp.]|nr:YraN family protein [Arenibaculum sp.]